MVGIKDIARAAGVSIGTVDRALHDKPGINPATRQRVLARAASLGYRPNLAARHLKSRTSFRVSVHLPREIALFWDSLRDGIREAAAPFEPTLQVEYRSHARLGEGDVDTGRPGARPRRERAHRRPRRPGARSGRACAARPLDKVPVVCVVTDAPVRRSPRVGVGRSVHGRLGGRRIARALPARRRRRGVLHRVARHRGPRREAPRIPTRAVGAVGRGVRVAEVVEAHDDEQVGYRRALRRARRASGLEGASTSARSTRCPVLRAVERRGRTGRISVVTTDLFPALVPYIREGTRRRHHLPAPAQPGSAGPPGALPVPARRHPPPRPASRWCPHVVMRSNLELLLQNSESRTQNPEDKR